MVNRFIGFWQSLNRFFDYFNQIITESTDFIPPMVSAALTMFAFIAIASLMIKFALSVVNLGKALVSAIFFFV